MHIPADGQTALINTMHKYHKPRRSTTQHQQRQRHPPQRQRQRQRQRRPNRKTGEEKRKDSRLGVTQADDTMVKKNAKKQTEKQTKNVMTTTGCASVMCSGQENAIRDVAQIVPPATFVPYASTPMSATQTHTQTHRHTHTHTTERTVPIVKIREVSHETRAFPGTISCSGAPSTLMETSWACVTACVSAERKHG